MHLSIAEQELYRACQIIFGAELNISNDFLKYLQWSGVKSAYRKKAFETHPDRVARLGEQAQRRHADMFKTVQEAYENLTAYLQARDKGHRLSAVSSRPVYRQPSVRPEPKNTATETSRFAGRKYDFTQSAYQTGKNDRYYPPRKKTKGDIDKLYNGPVPKRKLMTGHYLYYSGIITWRMVVKALTWQRSQRPRLGEIGRRFGMLNEEDIKRILKIRTLRQPFGRSAVKLGLLTESQLNTLIAHQNRVQKKFGQYFVEKHIIESADLEMMLKKFRKHNAIISSPYIFKC